jgi:hypothetical protein
MTLNETIILEYEIENNETDVDANLEIEVPESTSYFNIAIEYSTSALPAANILNKEATIIPLINSNSSKSSSKNYKVEFLKTHAGGTAVNVINHTIPASQISIIKITVKLIKTPVTAADSSIDFDVNITASPSSSTV